MIREKLGNHIYGCDDCLSVCPWNKYAQQAAEQKLIARDELNAPSLTELAALSEKEFRRFFAGSPIKRIGHNRFLRNVLYGLGNSGRPELAPAAKAHIHSPDPTVRDAAQWALKRLKG